MEVTKEQAANGNSQIKREVDSVDDFEHLGHDSSPLNELKNNTADLLGLSASDVQAQARDHSDGIDNRVETVGIAFTGSSDGPAALRSSLQNEPLVPEKMDVNIDILQMGGDFPDRKEADAKLDKFLNEYGEPQKADAAEPQKFHLESLKSFMDNEREIIQEQIAKQADKDFLDRYSDSEPEEDDFKPSKYDDFPNKSELPESFGSTENIKGGIFKDVQPEPPKKDYPATRAEPVVPQEQPKEKTPSPVTVREKTPEPVEIKKIPEPVKDRVPVPEPETVLEAKKNDEKAVVKKPKIAPADAEAIFCKMGLDAWFNPERLNPKVESLIYWRDPKKSGPVFGGVLLVLLALTYFSLISVVAYLSLFSLSGTIAFRIYKNIVQAVQKTGDGHPFKELLELDVSLPQDKVREISEVAVAHINAAVVELRRLFLVEDLVDSIKFGVLLWTLRYLGAWFNGLTLIILAWVALFTLPKIYETNKKQIDANLEIVRTKIADITSKVKTALPIGKKVEEKKEQ